MKYYTILILSIIIIIIISQFVKIENFINNASLKVTSLDPALLWNNKKYDPKALFEGEI